MGWQSVALALQLTAPFSYPVLAGAAETLNDGRLLVREGGRRCIRESHQLDFTEGDGSYYEDLNSADSAW
ncbi:MAG: hypothetical protein IT285_03750 [Bdellovibrionales bacterium]|nr:hypothetical protein [Bdellovibrionales bacterium]